MVKTQIEIALASNASDRDLFLVLGDGGGGAPIGSNDVRAS